MKEFDVDRALGRTPEGFHQAMHAALNACRETDEAPHAARPRRMALIGALALALALLTGSALALIHALGGMQWFLQERIGYWPRLYPETYARVMEKLQSDIPLECTGELVTLRAQDAAWLPGELFVATFQASPKDENAVELYDAMVYIADGEGKFRIATERGFEHPRLVMRAPQKRLLLFDIEWDFHIGAPNGPSLLAYCMDSVTTAENQALFYVEFDLKHSSESGAREEYAQALSALSAQQRAAVEASPEQGGWKAVIQQAIQAEQAIEACTQPDGTLTLYVDYTLSELQWNRAHPERTAEEACVSLPGGTLRLDIKIR